MNFKKIASLLAVTAAFASGAAQADDQTVTFASGSNHVAFDSVGTAFAGGSDDITFAGLTAGAYEFGMTLAGQHGLLTGISLNGVAGTFSSSPGGHVFFGFVIGEASTPFVLTLTGLNLGTAKNPSVYSGDLTVTAVPEPTTYALLLAGLGAVGFVARRRKAA